MPERSGRWVAWGLFDGSGRIGRLAYLGIAVACGLAPVLAVYAFAGVDEVTREPTFNPLVLPVFFASTWLSVTNTIRRLHDVGRSGWTALLLLVPIIGSLLSLYLLFAPGDPRSQPVRPPPGAAERSSAGQRQRADLIAAAAGEAYRARSQSNLLNDDGSYNMDGLTTDQPSSPDDDRVGGRRSRTQPELIDRSERIAQRFSPCHECCRLGLGEQPPVVTDRCQRSAKPVGGQRSRIRLRARSSRHTSRRNDQRNVFEPLAEGRELGPERSRRCATVDQVQPSPRRRGGERGRARSTNSIGGQVPWHRQTVEGIADDEVEPVVGQDPGPTAGRRQPPPRSVGPGS